MTKFDSVESNLQEEEGKKLYNAGKFQLAANTYSQAADYYLGQENKLMSAEMSNNQCVALLKANQPDQALLAVQGTALLFKSEGMSHKQAMALANEATALKELRRYSEAVELFSQAADLFSQLNESEMHLQVMQSISVLKLRSRNLLGAVYSMQEGLEQVKKPSLRQRFLKKLLKLPQKLIEK